MEQEAGAGRRERAIDWLEMAPDLPHLFARLSELVHAEGYAPEELVLMPRTEVDRRETAAFTAGWAEAMSEELPRIRREYEERIAAAYAAGGSGRAGDPAARRAAAERGPGATVIRLPFATLIEPSPLLLETEERMRRAQDILDRRPEHGHEQAAETDPGAPEGGRPHRHDEADADADAGAQQQEPAARASGDLRPDARRRRTARASRKVVRRNGRPIVPPLNSIPVQPRYQAAPAGAPADGPEGAPAGPGGRSLADRARALADDLETRTGASRPEDPGAGR